MIHSVSGKHIIDEFDLESFLLSSSAYGDWPFFRKFLQKLNISLDLNEFSNQNIVVKGLYQRLLYHTVNCSNSEVSVPAKLYSNKLQQQSDAKKTDVLSNTDFLRSAEWSLQDLSFLVGSDLAIFGTKTHPCISLKLNPHNEPINVFTGLDIWLENILNEVPEVAMFFHNEGIIMQEFEIYSTEDLPNLAGFNTDEVKSTLRNLVMFIKHSATKEGHTYWLVKETDSEFVKLYDLTSITSADDGSIPSLVQERNPFILPVATLCFRLAEHRMKQRDDYFRTRRHPSKAFLEDFLLDEKSFVLDVMRLLKNCLNLLSAWEEEVPISASDLRNRAASLLCRVYLSFNASIISECAKSLVNDIEDNEDTLSVVSLDEVVSSSALTPGPSASLTTRQSTCHDSSSNRLGQRFLEAFSTDNSSALTEMAIKFIEYQAPISPTLYTPANDDSYSLQLYTTKPKQSWQLVLIKHQISRSLSSLILLKQQLSSETLSSFMRRKEQAISLVSSLQNTLVQCFLLYRVATASITWQLASLGDLVNYSVKDEDTVLFIGLLYVLACISYLDLCSVSGANIQSSFDVYFKQVASFCHLLAVDHCEELSNELQVVLSAVPSCLQKQDIQFESKSSFLLRFHQVQCYVNALKLALDLIIESKIYVDNGFWSRNPKTKNILYPNLISYFPTSIYSFLNALRFLSALLLQSVPHRDAFYDLEWTRILDWMQEKFNYCLETLLPASAEVTKAKTAVQYQSKSQHQTLYYNNLGQLYKILHSICGNELIEICNLHTCELKLIPSLRYPFLLLAIRALLDSVSKQGRSPSVDILADLLRNTCQFLTLELFSSNSAHIDEVIDSMVISDCILPMLDQILHLVPKNVWNQLLPGRRDLLMHHAYCQLGSTKISIIAAKKRPALVKSSAKLFAWEKQLKDLKWVIQTLTKNEANDLEKMSLVIILYAYFLHLHVGVNEGILSISGCKSLVLIYEDLLQCLVTWSKIYEQCRDDTATPELKEALDMLVQDLQSVNQYIQSKKQKNKQTQKPSFASSTSNSSHQKNLLEQIADFQNLITNFTFLMKQ
ncbi:hypothetical protein Ciccas_004741 [Cichlidogyrus casuarinus]|uniref:EDRF1 N-terminal domain-containing protein n=1 Tax=Cichlidogyrus casuarinus TaxID=1844966 RepID=A0ABD2QAP2_9PLAT